MTDVAGTGGPGEKVCTNSTSPAAYPTIAPHRRYRTKPKTQDGRPLRRYKRRWKVERLIAWLQNFRRVIVRYEYYSRIIRASFSSAV